MLLHQIWADKGFFCTGKISIEMNCNISSLSFRQKKTNSRYEYRMNKRNSLMLNLPAWRGFLRDEEGKEYFHWLIFYYFPLFYPFEIRTERKKDKVPLLTISEMEIFCFRIKWSIYMCMYKDRNNDHERDQVWNSCPVVPTWTIYKCLKYYMASAAIQLWCSFWGINCQKETKLRITVCCGFWTIK